MTTRLYNATATPAYMPTTVRGSWGTKISANTGQASLTRQGVNGTINQSGNSGTAGVMNRRIVSPAAIRDGNIPSDAFMKWVIGQIRNAGLTAPVSEVVHAFITTGATDTPRSTLLNMGASTGLITTTSLGVDSGRQELADGLTIVTNDLIVFELGFKTAGGTGATGNDARYGGTATTDLQAASASTTTNPSWLQLYGLDWMFNSGWPLPLISTYEGADWEVTTGPKSTKVTTVAGDLVVVIGMSEANTQTLAAPIGNSLTFVAATSGGAASQGWGGIWTAVDSAGGTDWSLSQGIAAGSGQMWGHQVLQFRNVELGAAPAVSGGTGAATMSITTTAANSSVLVAVVDWSGTDGVSGTRAWAAVNGFTPTKANGGELNYFRSSTDYTVYTALYPDVGAAGAKTVGLSAPTPGGRTVMAIELKAVAPSVTEFEGWGVPI